MLKFNERREAAVRGINSATSSNTVPTHAYDEWKTRSCTCCSARFSVALSDSSSHCWCATSGSGWRHSNEHSRVSTTNGETLLERLGQIQRQGTFSARQYGSLRVAIQRCRQGEGRSSLWSILIRSRYRSKVSLLGLIQSNPTLLGY